MDRSAKISELATIALAGIALVAAMELGEVVLAPLALALVTGVVLSPFSELLARRSLSPLWGAILCLAATLTLIGGLVLVFQPVVVKLVDQAPKVWADIHNTIEGLRGLLRGFGVHWHELAR